MNCKKNKEKVIMNGSYEIYSGRHSEDTFLSTIDMSVCMFLQRTNWPLTVLVRLPFLQLIYAFYAQYTTLATNSETKKKKKILSKNFFLLQGIFSHLFYFTDENLTGRSCEITLLSLKLLLTKLFQNIINSEKKHLHL